MGFEYHDGLMTMIPFQHNEIVIPLLHSNI